jgi:hypothetical protein
MQDGSSLKCQKNIQHQVHPLTSNSRTAPEASPFSLVTTFSISRRRKSFVHVSFSCFLHACRLGWNGGRIIEEVSANNVSSWRRPHFNFITRIFNFFCRHCEMQDIFLKGTKMDINRCRIYKIKFFLCFSYFLLVGCLFWSLKQAFSLEIFVRLNYEQRSNF